ncbi:TPA: hypothetical protein HA246_07350 [Candidatus Woesearchaeota archaeon]|nr:hypothetical protein [Candidatus Woesearchaeota archaeon]
MLESISKLTGLKVLQSFDAQTEDQIMEVAASILDFTKLYNEIIKLVLLFALAILVIWIISQSISWYNSQKIIPKIAHIAKEKINFTAKIKLFAGYFLKFTVVSIIAFLLLITLIYLSFKALFVLTFTQAAIKPEFTTYLVPVLLVIVLYLTIASYTLIQFKDRNKDNNTQNKFNALQLKETLRDAINTNTFLIFILSFAVIALSALLITLFIRYLGMTAGATMAMVTPIILLEFPLIAFARIWLLTETTQIK